MTFNDFDGFDDCDDFDADPSHVTLAGRLIVAAAPPHVIRKRAPRSWWGVRSWYLSSGPCAPIPVPGEGTPTFDSAAAAALRAMVHDLHLTFNRSFAPHHRRKVAVCVVRRVTATLQRAARKGEAPACSDTLHAVQRIVWREVLSL